LVDLSVDPGVVLRCSGQAKNGSSDQYWAAIGTFLEGIDFAGKF
jgi:hypothetical protein